MSNINKSTVTLWKNRDYSDGSTLPKITSRSQNENNKNVENEFIENLKKQIYFMEMELKLMKEREAEINKSGGFTQLFNDDKDPTQHIQQLKSKYSNMRKKMEDQITDLNDKKREVTGQNVSLKSKLDTLQKLEKDVYLKLKNNTDNGNNKLNTLTGEFLNKQNERNELEANNRLQKTNLNNEIKRNEELEYNITSDDKMNQLDKEEFESQMKLLEDMTNEKMKKYDEVNNKIKELNSKTNEEPYFKTELEKRDGYKKKIEDLVKKVLETNTTVEGMELVNDYIVNFNIKIKM